jgi:hypothetical protein
MPRPHGTLTARAAILERVLELLTGQSGARLFGRGYASNMTKEAEDARREQESGGTATTPQELQSIQISFYPDTFDKLLGLSADGTVLGFIIAAGVLAESFADKHAQGFTEILLRNPNTGEMLRVEGGLPYKTGAEKAG